MMCTKPTSHDRLHQASVYWAQKFQCGGTEEIMERKLAYLGHGKLFYRSEGKSEQIDSPYGQDVIKRALERQAKNEWKTGGSSQAALYSRRSLWGTDRDGPDAVNVKVTAVAPSDSSDELMYVVSTESVGGLFKYNLKTQKETRIFHKERLFISDFAKHADGELLACCQRFQKGIASIALMRGNYVDEATEGILLHGCQDQANKSFINAQA